MPLRLRCFSWPDFYLGYAKMAKITKAEQFLPNNYNGKKQQQQGEAEGEAERRRSSGITTRRASRTAINMQSKCQIAGQMPNDQARSTTGARMVEYKGGRVQGVPAMEPEAYREGGLEWFNDAPLAQTIMAMIKATIVAQTE